LLLAFCENCPTFEIEMKKIHIILLVAIAVSIGAIVAMTGDYTTYGSFALSQANPDQTLNVVGYLDKEAELKYNPEVDANYFEFTMNDKDGTNQVVYYRGAKPQDFERSEQIVVKGNMEEGKFHAKEILMKCPSKYTDDEIRLKEKA
jgi:cytochrome c-type biogenesis protein CcmE